MSQSRRDFLRNTAAAAAAGASALATSRLHAAERLATGRRGAADGRKILVVVQLSGGNDGLNTVVPTGDDRYHRARPTLRIHAKGSHKLDDYVALHPRMTKLKALFDDGRAAIVQGAGYPSPSRSHFRSMEIRHTADPSDTLLRDGWLGRALAQKSGAFIGSELPLALVMPRGQVTVLPNLQSFRPLPDPKAGGDIGVRLAAIQQAQASKRDTRKNATLAFLEDAGRGALAASARVQEMAKAYATPVSYSGGLGQALRVAATLISGGAEYEIYYVAQGGYDTHANQFGAQANLLGELSENLAAFDADMRRLGRGGDVVTLTFSEFGRRVEENASRGTDHGTAGPMFVVGGAVKGGLYGAHPSLTKLDAGDLEFTTDFRRVYAAVLGPRWLGKDNKRVLRGAFEPLPIFG